MSRWSSEYVVAEYRDLQANCMAVDCLGEHAVLAGRRVLAIVPLDRPKDSIKKVNRQSKWEVSAVQWNPHPSHAQILVTATNQRVDLVAWIDGKGVQQGSLKAHTRVISDLDWSPIEASSLATCSVDTYTFLWDINDQRRPIKSLQAVSGANQVKWNKVNEHLLATAHDGDIRLWDTRDSKGSPVQYIAGHLQKIHGVDWSPSSEHHLATSSQDSTVKFWDVRNPKKTEAVMASGAPVWRARYAPFGTGMVTVVVPQLRRGENSLLLWNIRDLKQPVHTFVGHTDVVLEFQWRKHTEDERGDYQLVTWSRDQSLRIWTIESHLQKLCGHHTQSDSSAKDSESIINGTTEDKVVDGQDALEIMDNHFGSGKDEDTDGGTKVDVKKKFEVEPVNESILADAITPQQPRTLQQEFSLVNVHIPNVTVEEMNAERRICTFSAVSGKHMVRLLMTFPLMYPSNVAPAFLFEDPTTIDQDAQNKLIKILDQTSIQHVKHNRSCIEPCLRQLIQSLDNLTFVDRTTPDTDMPYNLQQPPRPMKFLPIYSYGSLQDANIPFPRTSGARFCGTDHLVCFVRPSHMHRQRTSEITPRALSALSAYALPTQTVRTPQSNPSFNMMFGLARSPPTDNSVSISSYYTNKDHRKKRARSKSRLTEQGDSKRDQKARVPGSPQKKQKDKSSEPVMIYNISSLLPIHRQLAENYVLDTEDICNMCNKNAAAAAAVGRRDLVQMWQLVSLVSSSSLVPNQNPDSEPPWAVSPFGGQLIDSLIDHYSSLCDVQTLAMLCCAFGPKEDAQQVVNLASALNRIQRSTSDISCANVDDVIEVVDEEDVMFNELADLQSDFSYSPVLNGWSNITGVKARRSNSWSEYEDVNYKFEEWRDPDELEKERHECKMRLLDPRKLVQYDSFKEIYGNILYRWGLKDKRAMVLKYCYLEPKPHKGLSFVTICFYCRQETRVGQCGTCKNYGLQCSICHLAVRGCSNFCLTCGHGGHSSHMIEWFRTHTVCPTGCGCRCLEDNWMSPS
ncbi:GATOR complex protein WDR59 isoform X2 [Lingula anatina]|uniref:GATOR complex protein WDR59 isoform X2 n=1 Tax=Lingula anatina TaxID=7574 RepID=A0A1S3J248_LINAN|nr:GATOR complex protein WDR59 isoform X2 [Lingula anatina]|eukprot:XP_013403899.1 GATOR complex protein WDR59 isoform X2 [Lingula anatina]